MKTPYWEKLKDPRWQRKRLEILTRDGFACLSCHDTQSTLHVHHKYYVSGRGPWNYPEFAYVTFCESCHEIEHETQSSECSGFLHWEALLDHIFGKDGNHVDTMYRLQGAISALRNQGASQRGVLELIIAALEEEAGSFV